jgi:hypothetical protein
MTTLDFWNRTFPQLPRVPIEVQARAYDYRCRACGTTETRTVHAGGSDAGTILCSGCRATEPVPWWRVRPLAGFVTPDITGLSFGPTLAELLDTGRPNTRIRDDAEGMVVGVKLKERGDDEPPHAAAQGDLFGEPFTKS